MDGSSTTTPSEEAGNRPGDRLQVEAGLARHLLYVGLGRLLAAPDAEVVARLDDGTFFEDGREALEALPGAGGPPGADPARSASLPGLESAWEELEAAWRAEGGGDLEDRRRRYHRVFGHCLSPDHPPYETQYGLGHAFAQSARLATVRGFYESFGLELSPEVRDRPDHLAIELEFAGFLSAKEAYHCEHGEVDAAGDVACARRVWLTDHVGPGIVSFAERMRRLAPAGFHRSVAECARALVLRDASDLGLEDALSNPLELVPCDDVTDDTRGAGNPRPEPMIQMEVEDR